MASIPPDHLAARLTADAYHHLIRTLCLALPPPLTGNPEDFARRDHAAIARIAALAPGNAAEADLAAQFVVASEEWMDYLRLAQLPATPPEIARKRRAQAISMMREGERAIRLLLRLQEARWEREANNAASDRAPPPSKDIDRKTGPGFGQTQGPVMPTNILTMDRRKKN